MAHPARSRQLVIGGIAAGVVAVLGCGTGGTAAADPLYPAPPTPVTVTPHAVGTGPSATAPSASSPAAPVAAPAPTTPAGLPGNAQILPPGPVQPALVPATSGTLRDYFTAKNVALEAQKPQGFDALDITLPLPTGWTQVPDPNVVDAFTVIANRRSGALYTPNAQVVVYKLIGDFDPNEAITHGFVDSQQQLGWRTTNASLATFDGFPSSLIEGTYRQNEMTLNTSQRHVIATSGSTRYLVSLAVTTAAAGAIGAAPATDAIVNGFRVAAPVPAPGPTGLPAPVPAPGPTGLPGPVSAPAQPVGPAR